MEDIKIQIKREKPPKWVWDEVHRLFEIDDAETIYTYGNIIYDARTSTYSLDQSVIEHEKVHMRQQAKVGVDVWWKLYLTDKQLRREYEIEAYQRQYQHACTVYKDRNTQARYLDIIATFASSPMYKIDLTKSEALKLIRNGK